MTEKQKEKELDRLMDDVAAATEKTSKKGKTDMNKEEYLKAKAEHKAGIAQMKQGIKKHKLLIKQAKIAYKLSKMKVSKSNG